MANSIMPGSELSSCFNIRGTTNLTDKFNIDTKVTYFVQNSHNRPVMGTEGANSLGIPHSREQYD
ncbi:MAG: hypothetical protein R2758_05150 [Bacteroidales bacterium]